MKVPLNLYLIQDEAAIPGYDLVDSLYNIANIMETNDQDAVTTSDIADESLKDFSSEKFEGKLTVEQLKRLLTDVKVASLVIPDEYVISVWTMILLEITKHTAPFCAEVARSLFYDSMRQRGDVKFVTLYLFKEFIKNKKVT